uniref:Integrase catalytic domain-containing protein n=1 Tax=Lactuca sativa TaxID=4236 RepID=A0A9R1X2I7_LACSA|nr:hypothetical protein LSAT_V11C700362240 [Lactuca sativa]
MISKAFYVQDDNVAWWVDSGATSHVFKDQYWFKDFQPINDGSVVKMGNIATEPIKGIGSVLLTFTSGKCLCLNNVLYVPEIRKNLVSEIVLNNCGYKQVLESDKYILSRHGSFMGFGYVCNGMIRLNINYPFIDNSICMAPYTPQQNGVAERKNRTLKEMVNSMLSYSGLSEGFWGEAMLTACYILNRTPNKRSKNTPYELWCKKVPNLSYLKVWGCRAVVRLTEPKRKTLGERGIDCIFIGYVEHSKAYRFYVLESNDSVSVNTVIESRDAIFDEERFTSIPRPRDMVHQSSRKSTTQVEDVSGGVSFEPRKSTRARKAKSFGSDFQLYLVEGTRNETISQHQYCFNIEEDPKTFSEAVASRDVHFWKEAIHDEIDSIMYNNTWILADLPPGCKALGCKWILKRKMKVDGTIDKYKARLVIQGFRQKEGIDFFDSYALVAIISTIRLLLALAAIHNLVTHQMDVKTAFLNGDLDEEIYMKQPEGFVMPGNEHKFDDVVLSNGFALNQADKCVYIKFDTSGKGVMICLYVDDMFIFGTDLEEVDKTKKFLSFSFDMKDMGETEVILGTINYGLTYSGYPSVLEGYSDANWINNLEDHSSTSGWVFLLGGGAISWASKKQTCITNSTMESEFVALSAAGKEAEWLRNLIYEIPFWPKPISTISIRCDSAATLAKAYSQVYNGKSRHLDVRHSMIRELIMTGVISVEFVRTQLNLADHLTKGFARDLVHKAAVGMGLKYT